MLDASRAVGVVGQLKEPEKRAALDAANRAEQERLRREHEARQKQQPLVSLEEARRRRTRSTGRATRRRSPSSAACAQLERRRPARELVPFIDWSPFFAAWELRGTYPRIFENPEWGAKARELFDDAQELLRAASSRAAADGAGVYGFFPATAVGDDVEIYADESRSGLLGTLHTLRQQAERADGAARAGARGLRRPARDRARGLASAPSR